MLVPFKELAYAYEWEPQMQEPEGKPLNKSSKSRIEIINTVQTPLGFFVLVVLVVEGVLGVLTKFSDGGDRTLLIIGMLVVIVLLIGAVIFMGWRDGLTGSRQASTLDRAVTSSGNSDVPRVIRVLKPAVLCAASKEYESVGFEQDVNILEKFGTNCRIVHELTAPLLRRLLTEQEFHIVHLLNFVKTGDGTLVFAPDDTMSSEGFAALLDECKAQLVVLASCDSIDLAARVSRRTNIIAATTNMTTNDFAQWAECFYRLLFRGQPLSRAFEIARATINAPMVLLMKHDLSFLL